MLEFENVTKNFGSLTALSDVSFNVAEGDFVFITGPSGAGKTTLLRMILRELLPNSGKILLEGTDITKIPKKDVPKLRQQMGVVFQDFKVLPERTVRENVEVALAVSGLEQKEWIVRVEHVLKLVGLMHKIDLFPSQLSGGELQRVSMARALVVNPKIILADEPTGNLDWETADKLMELFDKINQEGKTIIMATHNKLIVDRMGKKVIEIKSGRKVSEKKENSKPAEVDKKSREKKRDQDEEEKEDK